MAEITLITATLIRSSVNENPFSLLTTLPLWTTLKKSVHCKEGNNTVPNCKGNSLFVLKQDKF